MDTNLIKIIYYVDGHKDTFYEIDLYKYKNTFETLKKLSTIRVIGNGAEVLKRNLTTIEENKIFDSIEKINIQYENNDDLGLSSPSFKYRLKIKTTYFKMDFKWSSEGFFVNHKLLDSLDNAVETICNIQQISYQELGLMIKK
jgi:hypothetical protein